MSKSVKLSRNAASTGSRKNTPIRKSAGPRKTSAEAPAPPASPGISGRRRRGRAGPAGAGRTPRAASAAASGTRLISPLRFLPREQPAPLLEDAVDLRVQCAQRLIHRGRAARRALALLEHLGHDQLGLRHL